MSIRKSSIGLLLTASAYAYTPCPLLGPSFEPSRNLGDAPAVQEAFETLQAALENSTKTGQTDYGTWAPANNSFSIGVFDATTPGQLFYTQHSSETLQNAEQGVHEVTADTIFRLGSVSKLITTYLFMVEAGPKYWNRPVTDFVPQLKQAAEECCASDDPVGCTNWDMITLGSLASHMAGVPRDYSTPSEILSPLNAGPKLAVQFGLPPLPNSATPPCGLAAEGCSAEGFLDGVVGQDPSLAPFATPVYSNIAFSILGLALENITGRSMNEMLEEDLFGKLNMTGSSFGEAKSVDDAAVPLGAELFFGADAGAYNANGGMFSTVADLSRMGQSILASKLLKPAVTRQWLKPVTFSSRIDGAVGMPWEIYRVSDLTDHVLDLYTKSGDLYAYSTYIVLSPDYNIGFAILGTGDDISSTVEQLTSTITAGLFPAVGNATRQQADAKYAGTYTSADAELNSTLTISTQPGKPGLVVSGWISNGTSIDIPLSQFLGESEGYDIRLYPTGLVSNTSPTRQQIGYYAIFDNTSNKSKGGVFDTYCSSWISGLGLYGNVEISDFVFEVEDGKVVSIKPKAFRAVLEKQVD